MTSATGHDGTTTVLSCGVVIVRNTAAGCQYLLLRAYRNWDFPKGLVEHGEEPLDAACREVTEETTLTDLQFRWGHDYRETPPYGKGKIARYYVAASTAGDVHLPISPELGHPEHDEFRWVGLATAQKLASTRLQPILSWAHAVTGCD